MSAARYTEELQKIAGNATMFAGDIDQIFARLSKRLSSCLKVERINIWMFNEGQNRIECIGNYTHSTDEITKGEMLRMKDTPEYYTHLKSNAVLVIEDVNSSPITREINETYCMRHGILSMLDVPINIRGELKGVVCYEHVGSTRKWDDEEIQFALAANQLLALALEANKRQIAEKKMKAIVQEKELLLKEMHHRIKNNLSVLTSLLRMQSRESGNPHVESVLSDCETRIFSMAKIHEHLYYSQNYLEVDLDRYLQQLVEEFCKSNISNADNITFTFEFDEVKLETSRAINLGLIVTEILTNITKHAFPTGSEKEKSVKASLKQLVSSVMLQIEDNGSGFQPKKDQPKTLGLTLIEDLSEQIDARLHLNSGENGTTYIIQFQV